MLMKRSDVGFELTISRPLSGHLIHYTSATNAEQCFDRIATNSGRGIKCGDEDIARHAAEGGRADIRPKPIAILTIRITLKNAPPPGVFEATETIFKLIQDIIGTYLLTKFIKIGK
ncbi:hypothetical protein DPMN_048605 [Dreissena polymorpha]|uniref:Uncharacterized protein n=1 Tax=Dreissena polymorpha TaxID=45954 RepID=A0A9D4DBH2_DREPO|nr:hypothetical protein DPMN_048605 [Dreissena polymorpha]